MGQRANLITATLSGVVGFAAVSEAAGRNGGGSSAIVPLPAEPVTYRPKLVGLILVVVGLVGFTVYGGVAAFRGPEGEMWALTLLFAVGLLVFAIGVALDKIVIEPGRVRVRRIFKSHSFEAGNSKVYVETQLNREGPFSSSKGPRHLNLRIEKFSPRDGTSVNVDGFRRRNRILIVAQVATALDTPLEGIEQIDECFLPASYGLSVQEISARQLSRHDPVAHETGGPMPQDQTLDETSNVPHVDAVRPHAAAPSGTLRGAIRSTWTPVDTDPQAVPGADESLAGGH